MGTGLWLVICGTEPGTGAFRIQEGRQTVGRGSDCEIHLSHPKVSRRHAEIVYKDGKLSIRDLGSRNGTFVDGKPVRSATIQVGSSLRIGHVLFDVVDHVSDRSPSVCDAEDTDRAPVHDPAEAYLRAARFPPARKRVLQLLLEGRAEKQIAVELDLSDHVVHRHTKKIYKIYGVHSRGELCACFREKEPAPVPRDEAGTVRLHRV